MARMLVERRRNSMKRVFDFYLKGVGYVRSIELANHQATACIEVSDAVVRGDVENGKPDHILLECHIPAHLTRKLQRIKHRCRQLEGAAVRFRAIYDRFGVCQAGQGCDESLNLLNMRCQLVNIALL
jgi:hypothetical protein